MEVIQGQHKLVEETLDRKFTDTLGYGTELTEEPKNLQLPIDVKIIITEIIASE